MEQFYEMTMDLHGKGQLSLVLSLVDDYSHSAPMGKITVQTPGRDCRVVAKTGGYWLLYDLAIGEHDLYVESEYYFPLERTLGLSGQSPIQGMLTFLLKPKPCLPFPPGTTLVRGMVQRPGGDPAAGATIAAANLLDMDVINISTVKGEFVLYFPVLGEDHSLVEDGVAYVKSAAGRVVTLEATLGEEQGRLELKGVPEGRETILKSPIILQI